MTDNQIIAAVVKWMRAPVGVRKIVRTGDGAAKVFLSGLTDKRSPKTAVLSWGGLEDGGYSFGYGNATMTGNAAELSLEWALRRTLNNCETLAADESRLVGSTGPAGAEARARVQWNLSGERMRRDALEQLVRAAK